MPDFNKYFCVLNLNTGDPNPKFYSSAPIAYKELDRREAYGLECDVVHREDWTPEIMEYYSEMLSEVTV